MISFVSSERIGLRWIIGRMVVPAIARPAKLSLAQPALERPREGYTVRALKDPFLGHPKPNSIDPEIDCNGVVIRYCQR